MLSPLQSQGTPAQPRHRRGRGWGRIVHSQAFLGGASPRGWGRRAAGRSRAQPCSAAGRCHPARQRGPRESLPGGYSRLRAGRTPASIPPPRASPEPPQQAGMFKEETQAKPKVGGEGEPLPKKGPHGALLATNPNQNGWGVSDPHPRTCPCQRRDLRRNRSWPSGRERSYLWDPLVSPSTARPPGSAPQPCPRPPSGHSTACWASGT